MTRSTLGCLAKSRVPGDSFNIQLRLEPWVTGASVSTIKQVALTLGSDRVTFDWDRAGPVWVNGSAASISMANPKLTLNGGTVTEVTPDMFQVDWNTGESTTITNVDVGWRGPANYINVADSVPVGLPGFSAV